MNIFTRLIGDSKERFLFLFFTLFGIALILILRILNDQFLKGNFFLNIFTVILAMFLIFIYSAIILKTLSPTSNSLDRASDNAYYIGLLYTLVSLSYSLIKLLKSIGPDQIIESKVVLSLLPDFGLALGTTIAGIGARVWLGQFTNNSGEFDNEAREQLGKMVSEIKTSMIQFQGDLNTLSKTYNNSSEELNRRVSETLAEATKIHADNIKTVSMEMVTLAEENKKQILTIGDLTLNISKSLESSAETLKTSFDSISTSIETNMSNLTENLDNSSQKISNVVSTIDSAAQQISITVRLLSGLNDKEKEVTETFQQIVSRLKLTLPKLNQVETSITAINTMFVDKINGLDNNINDLKDTAKDINKSAVEVKSSTKAAKESTSRYIKALNDSADNLNDDT